MSDPGSPRRPMFVNAGRPVRILAVSAFAAAIVAALAWSAGFFYWQFTLSRAIRILHREIRQLKQTPGEFPYDRVPRHQEIDDAMSRAVPRLLKETDVALSNENQVMACIFNNYLALAAAQADSDLVLEDHRHYPIKLVTTRVSLQDLRHIHRENQEWWKDNHTKYPPWWMWWSGKRRTP